MSHWLALSTAPSQVPFMIDLRRSTGLLLFTWAATDAGGKGSRDGREGQDSEGKRYGNVRERKGR